MSLRARWDKLLRRTPAEDQRGLFDTPPRRTPQEQAVIDAKQRKLLGDEEAAALGERLLGPTGSSTRPRARDVTSSDAPALESSETA